MTPETKYDYRNAVPHYMRTRRLTPRLLAACTVFVSVFIFGWGTQSLARLQEGSRQSPLDDLRPGTKTVALLESGTDAACLGLLRIQLSPKAAAEDSSSLSIDSHFRVSDGQNSVLVATELSLSFDYLGELMDLDAHIHLAELARLRIRGGIAEEPLRATLSLPAQNPRTLTLFPVGRIFLYETVKGQYRIRLPNSLRGMEKLAEFQNTKNLRIEEQTPEEVEACSSTLKDPSSRALLTTPLGQRLFESDGSIVGALENLSR